MSFGHGLSAETHDFRAIPLGLGDCTAIKAAGLTQLRTQCLEALRTFGAAAFTPEPLLGTASKSDLTKQLLALQKTYVGLNKAYLERCRTQVIAAVVEQNKRYGSKLLGRLRHVADEIPAAEREPNAAGEVPIYWHVPVALQDTVTPAELADLARRAPDAPSGLAFFKAVVLDGQTVGLTPTQIAVVRAIHAAVQERHQPPAFGGADTTVALPLDYRVLPSHWKALPAKLEGLVATLLRDENNTRYPLFLDIAHPTPGGPRLRLPMTVAQARLTALFRRNKRGYVARGLTLLLGPRSVSVQLTVAQAKTVTPLDQADYLLARDFGQKNTTTLSLLKLDRALDAQTLAQLQALDKDAAYRWLTTHALPDEPAIVARYRHSGEQFLRRIHEHASRIDALRSAIDLGYQQLEKEKQALATAFGLAPDADGGLPRLERRMAPKGHPQHAALVVFLNRLGHVKNLKNTRKETYRRIAALKRNWFGYLANIERALAVAWNAAVVEEHLTYTTIERESPAYKGRTFNRVMNHAARGQYARAARQKHAWNGIPVLTLPSYYTSTTCFRHGRVNARFRQGDVFSCPDCRAEGRGPEHADEHAADTLAAYALLLPKARNVTNTPAPHGVGSTVPSGR